MPPGQRGLRGPNTPREGLETTSLRGTLTSLCDAVRMASPHATATGAPDNAKGLGFETIPTPMALLSQDLAIVEANAAFAGLMGVPAASLIGEPLAHRLRDAAS